MSKTRQLLANEAVLLTQFGASFYATIGSNWNDAMDESFDWELAEESLAFFDVNSVPKVEAPIPPGVFDVRFCSDLSAVAPLESTRSQVVRESPLGDYTLNCSYTEGTQSSYPIFGWGLIF
ncbi:MAG TPA: hypothetical protein VG759_19230 [Candidatus Angelobacter sp.]|nr:hypothetical protein [Candidatus Angelobacter sp.]